MSEEAGKTGLRGASPRTLPPPGDMPAAACAAEPAGETFPPSLPAPAAGWLQIAPPLRRRALREVAGQRQGKASGQAAAGTSASVPGGVPGSGFESPSGGAPGSLPVMAAENTASPPASGGDAYASHVFVIVLTPQGRVLDCDRRGERFLRSGQVLRLARGCLVCTDASRQVRLAAALHDAALAGRTSSVLLQAPDAPERRFSVTLTPLRCRLPAAVNLAPGEAGDLLCLVAPLDRQRIATARQLMDLFGLSGAEARLARALCHGDSAESYASEQGLRLPTVRTQLSAVFKKTGTSRQAALVRLIAGIPVVRDFL